MSAYEPEKLTALVADDNHFERGITLDILRTCNVGRVLQASNGLEGWDAFITQSPDCVFLDWLSEPMTGLDLVRRIRLSEESPNRSAPIFILTTRGMRADVESARRAGVNAFLRKPISVAALELRLRAIISNPRPFIQTANYAGPCRRRREDDAYKGPRRRLNDELENADAFDEEVKKELAKARIAFLESQAARLQPNDADSMRRVFAATRDLIAVAEESEDIALKLGASELARYLETMGASAGLDAEALSTHIAALHQLVHLPNAMDAERHRVAQSLSKMVDKKIRQHAAA